MVLKHNEHKEIKTQEICSIQIKSNISPDIVQIKSRVMSNNIFMTGNEFFQNLFLQNIFVKVKFKKHKLFHKWKISLEFD